MWDVAGTVWAFAHSAHNAQAPCELLHPLCGLFHPYVHDVQALFGLLHALTLTLTTVKVQGAA